MARLIEKIAASPFFYPKEGGLAEVIRPLDDGPYVAEVWRRKPEGSDIHAGQIRKILPTTINKIARKMPSFTKQDRPAKVKEIYRALKREHPGMPAEMKARIAARQGRPGKQSQGPPYKSPIVKSAAGSYIRTRLREL